MTRFETIKYITKTGTVYQQTKEFEDETFMGESWLKIKKDETTKIRAAGYIVSSDKKELEELYKRMGGTPNPGADTTMNIGECRNSDSLINLINDFKYSGDQYLGGQIVFLENSGSIELKASPEIVKILK